MVRDPIQLEILKNALITIGDEMGITVVRNAHSTPVKEAGDATSAIFDAEGRLLAQSRHAPLYHLSSLRPSLQELMKDFPPGAMRDGDVYLFNDPYRGGIHSNDVMVIKPVFAEARLTFFAAALIHVADLGGIAAGGLPATATDVYQEGLILPPVKLYDGGEPVSAILDIIQANSRTPDKVVGDIRAMVAADNIGAARLVELVQRYGREELLSYTGELMDYSERLTRQEIAKLPQGIHRGTFLIDGDGLERRPEGLRVEAAVKIEGSTFGVDFTGTDHQARGPINSAVSQSMSGVVFALRCLIDPTIPMNEGCYRPIKAHFPLGTLVNPRPPAACNARLATVMAAVDAILRAVSTARPDRATASAGCVHLFSMSGTDVETRRIWTFYCSQPGTVGAHATGDGVDCAGGNILSGQGAGYRDAEPYEIEYPVLFTRCELWEDSGGPGKWRGGLGMRRDVQALTEGDVTLRIVDRSEHPPPGILGGDPGRGGAWILNAGTEGEIRLPSKQTNFPLKAGDTLTMLSSGGGGFGPPGERDVDLVLRDVLDRKVTIEAARRDYGVAIGPQPSVVDADETKRLRTRMAARPAS